ncbi:TRAFs-binding domain-containing protein [Litorimonas sp. RW-G-Af-16]|uniref:TRAFs-binding domain-containing protein n=1 Tax=Litorimonas sp. RW-G-Af-16 TaxID=3241168 RepID=UPI00390C6324
MKTSFTHNYLQIYEQALAELKAVSPTKDSAISLKHKAVLALARAGALDFARAEYERYGLDQIADNEDVIALSGRLFKDAALRVSGKKRQALAQQSADAYEAAFSSTGGYYSAINAATMMLLGGANQDDITARASAVIDMLPAISSVTKEDVYFVKATHAEAELLRENHNLAARYLRSAVAHDPLNYTAHASTLRQFKMILEARGESTTWLSDFTPPKAMHFAGHMFQISDKQAARSLNAAAVAGLRVEISDALQRADIGFGFGALAAGADILIAETLLEEGGELHVVLPTQPDIFKAASVSQHGGDWGQRFDDCLDRASSLHIAQSGKNWPNSSVAEYASQIAMGFACMQANLLSSQSTQLLIWDGEAPNGNIGTGFDAAIWDRTSNEQIIIPYPADRKLGPSATIPPSDDRLAVVIVGPDGVQSVDDPRAAADMLLASTRQVSTSATFGAHFGPVSLSLTDDEIEIAKSAQESALPGTAYISEAFAAVLCAFHKGNYRMDFAGLSGNGDRLFSLQSAGQT